MAKSQVKGSKKAKTKPPFYARTEARLSFLFTAAAGGFVMTIIRNETHRHSAALKSASQSPIGLLTLDRGSRPMLRNASIWCRITRPHHVSFESFPNQRVIRKWEDGRTIRPTGLHRYAAESTFALQFPILREEIKLEILAVDVVDASSEGMRTGFAGAVELDALLGDKLSQTSNSRILACATDSTDNLI